MKEMKTEHTPGPWFVYSSPNRHDLKVIGETIDTTICNVNVKNDFANARLIAAAPDMLEAMEKYVHHLEMFFSSPRVGQPPGLEGLKAAIEKAKGKSQ